MRQHEAVAVAMRQAGGYATLGYLYRAALQVPGCNWGTLTPFASIRRIVQTRPEFFKIRPGLWALASERNRILADLSLSDEASSARSEAFDHSYYQGLVVEIGNLKRYETSVPQQDKNRRFLQHKLADVVSLRSGYAFTYDRLLRRAGTVDVVWFNARKFPHAFFEVEHSTDIRNSLFKYLDFQDFRLAFYIVADSARQREFQDRLAHHTFAPIRSEVKFMDYDTVSGLHTKLSASVAAEQAAQLQ